MKLCSFLWAVECRRTYVFDIYTISNFYFLSDVHFMVLRILPFFFPPDSFLFPCSPRPLCINLPSQKSYIFVIEKRERTFHIRNISRSLSYVSWGIQLDYRRHSFLNPQFSQGFGTFNNETFILYYNFLLTNFKKDKRYVYFEKIHNFFLKKARKSHL